MSYIRTAKRRTEDSLVTLMVSLAFAALTTPLRSFAVTNQTPDHVYLIEIVDSTGEKTYQTTPLEQYQRLRAEASLRNRFQSKAIGQAKDEWKETYSGVSKPFPQNMVSPESVTSLGLFTSQDAAHSKLMEVRAKAEQRRSSDDDKLTSTEKQIKALEESIARLKAAPSNSISDRDAKIQASRLALKVYERDFAEQKAKKTRQEEDQRAARTIFEKKLTDLVSAAAK